MQPVAELAAVAARARHPVAHRRGAGRRRSCPVDFAASGVDALTVTGHKLGGPIGVGALLLAATSTLVAAAARRRPGARRPLRHPRRPGDRAASPSRSSSRSTRQAAEARPARPPCATTWSPACSAAVPDARAATATPATAATGCPATRTCSFPGCEGDSLLLLLDAARHRVLDRLGLPAGVPSPATCCSRWACRRRTARGVAALHPSATPPPTPTSTRSLAALPAGRRAGPARRLAAPAGAQASDARARRDVGGVDSAVAAARPSTPATTSPASTSRCRADAATLRDRRPRLLHASRTPATRAGPPTCSASRSTSGTSPSGSSEDVVDDFVAEYAAGRTPNPCLRCNEKIKFAARARPGARARLRRGRAPATTPGSSTARTGRELHRAVDPAKDQSYVLGVLDAASSSARSMFPLGDTTKAAGPRGGRASAGCASPTSPTATTSASSPTATPAGFLAERLGARPGDDRRRRPARSLGEHDGAYALHRRPAHGPAPRHARPPTAQPRYVARHRSPVTNTVTVGTADAARRRRARPATTPAGAAPPPQARRRLGAQVRAHGEEVPAHGLGRRRPGRGRASTRRIRGVAPGQAVVLYDGTRVVGSATISAAATSR